MSPNQLTQDAFDRLQKELDERSTTGRKELSAKIEEARDHGDLKENAEYHAAKDEQGHNEARIRQLESILDDAEIVASSPEDSVGHGNLVEIRIEDDEGHHHIPIRLH